MKITIRMGPPILGRGYLEAISDDEIRRVATEQESRTDGIHGKLNTVVYHSVPNPDSTFGVFTSRTGEPTSAGSASRRASRRSTTSPPTRSRATWA